MKLAQKMVLAAMFCGMVTVCIGGCGQSSPFRDGDTVTQRKKRYWDGETVRGTSESRKQARDMGFGFPTGQ